GPGAERQEHGGHAVEAVGGLGAAAAGLGLLVGAAGQGAVEAEARVAGQQLGAALDAVGVVAEIDDAGVGAAALPRVVEGGVQVSRGAGDGGEGLEDLEVLVDVVVVLEPLVEAGESGRVRVDGLAQGQPSLAAVHRAPASAGLAPGQAPASLVLLGG